MPLSIGQVLQSRYCIIRLLGRGHIVAVYLAEALRPASRRCIVKEYIRDPTARAQALCQRLEVGREAAHPLVRS